MASISSYIFSTIDNLVRILIFPPLSLLLSFSNILRAVSVSTPKYPSIFPL
nr:hypothetical protein [Methanobrevibacter arboriphilus]